MRKLLRSIARDKMQKQGIQHINRKISVRNPKTNEIITTSYFATHWREYI